MSKLLFLILVCILTVALLTHFAVLPPQPPQDRLKEKLIEIRDKSYSKANKPAGRDVFQKRHFAYFSVRRQ